MISSMQLQLQSHNIVSCSNDEKQERGNDKELHPHPYVCRMISGEEGGAGAGAGAGVLLALWHYQIN